MADEDSRSGQSGNGAALPAVSLPARELGPLATAASREVDELVRRQAGEGGRVDIGANERGAEVSGAVRIGEHVEAGGVVRRTWTRMWEWAAKVGVTW